MKRPLFVIGICYFLSTAAALYFGDNFAAVVGLLLLAGGALSPLVVRHRRSAVAALLVVGALGMGGVLAQDLLYVRPVRALADKTVYLTGRVTQAVYTGDNARYVLDARIPMRDGAVLSTKVTLFAFAPLPMDLNDEVRGYMELSAPQLEGSYRFEALARRSLLNGVLKGQYKIIPAEKVQRSAGYRLTALRAYLIRQNQRLLPPASADLVNAMLLGEKSLLDDETLWAFKRAGVSHLTAVSGFHLSLVTALFTALLSALRIPRGPLALCTLPFILLFMGVAGFTASVLRAGLMLGVCLLARIVDERYDPPTALGFAMLVICVGNPYSALSLSFLLSFSATAGILFLGGPLTKIFDKLLGVRRFEGKLVRGRLRHAVAVSAAISLGAFLLSLPVQILFFDTFSLVAPLASLVVMPVASAALWFACGTLFMGAVPFLWPAAEVLAVPAALLCGGVRAVVKLFSAVPVAALPARFGFLRLLVMLFYLGAVALIYFRASKRLRLLCGTLAAAVFCVGVVSCYAVNRGVVRIAVFEGNGAALLMVDGRASLVGFPRTSGEASALEGCLLSENIHRLDLALSTAPDNETAAGTARLLEKFPPRAVVMPKEGRYTPHILAASSGARVALRQGEGPLETLGVRIKMIPCSCGCAAEISVNGAALLKCNENCVIMDYTNHTQGVVRGWILEKYRQDGSMKVNTDGAGTTYFTFRL